MRKEAAVKTIEFLFPLPRTHAGVAMGNGLFGALIWGTSSINITLNRSDFWDHRGAYQPTDGVTTYEHIKKAYTPDDRSWIDEVFLEAPKPLDVSNPRRLPFGRFELQLKPGCFPIKADLELAAGRVTIWIGTKEAIRADPILFDLSVTQSLLWVSDPAQMICGIAPRPSWEWMGNLLKRLAFPPPVLVDDAPIWGWAQACPDDPALASICRKTTRGYAIVLEMDKDAGSALDAAGKLAVRAEKTGFDAIEKANKAWWRTYWKRTPAITLPDAFLNRFYWYALYKFAAATNPQCPWPSGLQGPWIEEYQLAPWNGDYHFNGRFAD